MKHKQLLRLRKQPPSNQPWRPGCAILPTGLVLEASFLRSTTDPILFAEMFGVNSVDVFTQRMMRDGYAGLAEATETVIQKARNS
jgi:hypothetical protein